MPQFDLRGIKVANYVNTAGTVTYTGAASAGDAMNVNLELRFAEGRLYAESTLAEYMRKCVGGTISIGVKYIPDAVQTMLFGVTAKTRTVGSKTISSLVTSAKDTPNYVGVGFYAPDMVDGVKKYTAVKVAKALFGNPSMTLQTAGENITFNTPTTTGEFMADNSTGQDLTEVAVCDTEEDAIAWIGAVLQ